MSYNGEDKTKYRLGTDLRLKLKRDGSECCRLTQAEFHFIYCLQTLANYKLVGAGARTGPPRKALVMRARECGGRGEVKFKHCPLREISLMEGHMARRCSKINILNDFAER